jgi:3-aminobutyryl-CoA ammonia-lyase
VATGEDPSSLSALVRVRMSAHDAHYGGNLVDGARVLALFGDVATELLIHLDGDEGLFVAYDKVEFLAPVYAGDYIEASGHITNVGNTSRAMAFEARKVIAVRPDVSESAADFLGAPIVVCRATGTCVTPKDKKRR